MPVTAVHQYSPPTNTFHLMMCRFCRNYQKQLGVIQKILQRLDSQMESDGYSLRLPDQVQEKLKDLLSGHD